MYSRDWQQQYWRWPWPPGDPGPWPQPGGQGPFPGPIGPIPWPSPGDPAPLLDRLVDIIEREDLVGMYQARLDATQTVLKAQFDAQMQLLETQKEILGRYK